MDEIQEELHDDGKQLLVKTFNNKTEFIKFRENKQESSQNVVTVSSLVELNYLASNNAEETNVHDGLMSVDDDTEKIIANANNDEDEVSVQL